MKKIFIILLIVIGLFGITGCTKSIITKKNDKKAGVVYNIVSLKDESANVVVYQGLVPKNWKTSLESNWNVVSSATPGKETVTITSPDSSASIKIISQETYVENKKYNEGINKDYYTTYLHYMDAKTYLDYMMNRDYSGSKVTKELEVNKDYMTQLKAYNDIRLKLGEQTAKELNKVTPSVNVSISDYGTSASKKQYELGLNEIEASTAVAAVKTNLESSLSPLLSSEAIDWTIPYTIIYSAETKEDFDKYYKDYNFIVANSQFTEDYYALVEYVSSAITNAYTSYYNAKSKAALDAMNDYIDSNYSSTSAKSTNEKVMEMWDDCIKEVDAYKMEDGTILKTDMHNETVAQKDNEIYIGTKAGIPSGFNELSKSY